MTTKPTATKFNRYMLLLLTAGYALNCLPWRAMAGDTDPETKAKLDATLNHWKSVTPDYLYRPENQNLLRALKAVAGDRNQDETRRLLIKSNDENTICDALVDFRESPPLRRNWAMIQLMAATNPALIMRLYDDVFKDESPKSIVVGDVSALPVSMGAASIIREIINKSDAFSPAVKEWAKHLSYVDPSLRTQVRAWLDKNKAALSRGEYSATVIAQ